MAAISASIGWFAAGSSKKVVHPCSKVFKIELEGTQPQLSHDDCPLIIRNSLPEAIALQHASALPAIFFHLKEKQIKIF